MPSQTPEALKEPPVGGRFQDFLIGPFLAGGAYGRVHKGVHQQTKENIIIKFEHKNCDMPQLILEFGFYRTLGDHNMVFLPKIYQLFPVGEWNALAMEYLGPSLANMHKKRNYQLSTFCCVNITLQIVDILEFVHDHGIVHRDIKPDNFLLGLPNTPKWAQIHVIDFGTSKTIFFEPDSRHETFNLNKPIATTVRYMSINCHKQYEMSRRDDMEAICYMLAFLMSGDLPWQGITNSDMAKRYEAIGKIKEQTTPKQLFKNYPHEYAIMLEDVRSLEFAERPRYGNYRKLFRKLRNTLASISSNNFDWTPEHNII